MQKLRTNCNQFHLSQSLSSMTCLRLSFLIRQVPIYFCGSQLVQKLDFNIFKQFRVNSSWLVCKCGPCHEHGKSGELVDCFSHIPPHFFLVSYICWGLLQHSCSHFVPCLPTILYCCCNMPTSHWCWKITWLKAGSCRPHTLLCSEIMKFVNLKKFYNYKLYQ